MANPVPAVFARTALWLLCAAAPVVAQAAPVDVAPAPAPAARVVRGPAAGPQVAVRVARSERAAVIGLDEQLAALELARGSLRIGPGEADGEAAGAAVRIEFRWEDTPAPTRAYRLPQVRSSDPERAGRWSDRALDGDGERGERPAVEALAADGAGVAVTLEFPAPRTGLSKARQFRHARRFVEAVLVELGMAKAQLRPWPPGFPARPALCLYDAEGAGGSGCENLERVVDSTNLPFRILPVCPEDIRDGGLRGMAAVLFPGGSGGGIARALEPRGVAAVRDFVGGGGGYVGICAGAYLAGSGLDSYAALLPWRHTQPWAKGSAQLEVELTDAGRDLFGAEFARFTTRYNNGPVYPDVLEQSRAKAGGRGQRTGPLVLANFRSASKDKKGVVHDAMVGTPAIAADAFDRGRVLVISPHPESHSELDVLTARAIAWAARVEPAGIERR